MTKKLYTVKIFSTSSRIVYWTGDVFAETAKQAELTGVINATDKVPALAQNIEHETISVVARVWEPSS